MCDFSEEEWAEYEQWLASARARARPGVRASFVESGAAPALLVEPEEAPA